MQANGSMTRAIAESARLIGPLARMVAGYAEPTDGEALICVLTRGPIRAGGFKAEIDSYGDGVIYTTSNGAWTQVSADELAERATGARLPYMIEPLRYPLADAVRGQQAMYR